jgi:hypothetical protein
MSSSGSWLEQWVAAARMALPRTVWVLAVAGVAVVAGERLPPSAQASGMASAPAMMEAATMESP